MQKAVEIQSRGFTLRGMLHMPENAGDDMPLVIICHGFTGNKMEPHFIFVKMSRRLEELGIASVRFDFAGSGESDGDFVDMTFSGELKDAEVILDYVKTLGFVDVDKIGLLGLSMGGAIASALAGKRKRDIHSLCLWAPAGTMRELILADQFAQERQEAEDNGFADINGLKLGIGFLEDIIRQDIYGKASAFNKKVMILHGDQDQTVPLAASQKYVEIYGEKSELHVIEGADHTFNRIDWEAQVINHTLRFFEKELLG